LSSSIGLLPQAAVTATISACNTSSSVGPHRSSSSFVTDMSRVWIDPEVFTVLYVL
jgi:hypothetical protein